jgi:hypothetical protein
VSFFFFGIRLPIISFYLVQRPHVEFASRFYRNLCIDGGYEICAEMYNKNILASLSTFVPKVCLSVCSTRRAARKICLSILNGRFI